MSRAYEATLSTANTTSPEIQGAELASKAWQAQATKFTVQIIPSGSGDWEVHLEAALPRQDGIPLTFEKIGEFTQESDPLLVVFDISLGAKYRFVHASGITVTCLMSS